MRQSLAKLSVLLTLLAVSFSSSANARSQIPPDDIDALIARAVTYNIDPRTLTATDNTASNAIIKRKVDDFWLSAREVAIVLLGHQSQARKSHNRVDTRQNLSSDVQDLTIREPSSGWVGVSSLAAFFAELYVKGANAQWERQVEAVKLCLREFEGRGVAMGLSMTCNRLHET
ncbi:hypothetical protein CVT24_008113 [Panaeolus cyanescens]|uniref:Uncharacterized protein n=1 Tax=Panaeolus cyanescens TaxID=181874 RepID=A0A409YLH7_9AGAR|nr:hypothetical protein CVT24_008113 [Panaeolus cyanescens]